MQLRVKTRREVGIFTAIITAIAVTIPLVIVSATFALSPLHVGTDVVVPLLAIAGLIPLFITPPIAYVVLNLLRTQAEMIRRVDARIMFDMMTGVFNRNHFLDTIRAGQANGPMMIVDADHFKAINDSFGHAVGDEALCILANAINKAVGKDGFVGRLGGEEFGIFLPGKNKAQGHAKAEAICAAVRALHPLIAGKPVRLSVSIGCAYHRATKVIGHSMKEADDLLYRAKAEGRDRALYDMSEPKLRQSA
jgi:diguanylate cyclase